MTTQTDKAVKTLESSREMFSMVKQYYKDSFKAKEEGKLIAWITGSDPEELLWAMDIIPVYPENFATACGAKQLSSILCEKAEAEGFSPDICSYFRTAHGYAVGRDKLELRYPGGGMPDPDLVFCTLDGCQTETTWMYLMAKRYDVPAFIVDNPIVPSRVRVREEGPEIDRYYVDYVVSQLEAAVEFLEEVSGRKMDEDRLREALRLSNEAAKLWIQILELRKSVPCPASAEDMNSLAGARFILLGTQRCVDIHQKVLDEIKGRVERKEGVIPEEKYRLYIDGIPPWYSLGLFHHFHQYGAVSVIEFYSRIWHWEMDLSLPPLEALARKCLSNVHCEISGAEYNQEFLRIAREYHVDGAFFVANVGCKPVNVKSYELRNTLEAEMGIPTLLIELDQTDARGYQDAQIKTRIDAFMEVLEARKR